MSVKVKIGIVGSTGYSGAKLAEILSIRHDVSLVFLASQQYVGKNFSSVYPKSKLNIVCLDSDENFFNNLTKYDVDLVFFATPNGMASKYAPRLNKKNIDVIDLSADYRFRDLKIYEKHYGINRNDIEENNNAVYGLVEFNAELVKQRAKESAVIIGNPGCYTTSAILALSPALKKYHSIIDLDSIIVDGKSGISGAGRKAEAEMIYSEINESCSPYKLGGSHRHRPELEVFFSELIDREIKLDFSPHLVPLTQGLLTTSYMKFRENISEDELRKLYQETYSRSNSVRVLEAGVYPKTLWAMNSNLAFIQINYNPETRRATFTCAIDNLVKGAAGQAVENMDLILEARSNAKHIN